MCDITYHVLKTLLYGGSFCGSFSPLGPLSEAEDVMQAFRLGIKTRQSLAL